jgi:microcystin-dependent protein
MADAFYGEIRLLPYTYQPDRWMLCDGRTLQILHYQALFSIIGFTYGGDKQSRFKIPDLRGRTILGPGANSSDPFSAQPAASGGDMAVAIGVDAMPAHNHGLTAMRLPQAKRSATPQGNLLTGIAFRPTTGADIPVANPYATLDATSAVRIGLNTIDATGNDMPHENRQPALAIGWHICYDGDAYPVKS